MCTKRLSPTGDGESSDKPSDFGPTELVELDVEHYERLLVLAVLWRSGSPRALVEGVIDDFWTQLAEFVDPSLKIEDFRELGKLLVG